MALGDGGFRARAASLLHPSTPTASHSLAAQALQEKDSKTSVEHLPDEKRSLNHAQIDSTHQVSGFSGGQRQHFLGRNDEAHNKEVQKVVRTIPAWVHTLDEDDEDLMTAAQARPLIPQEIRAAQHNSSPSPRLTFKQGSSDGRRFDRQRESIPPLPHGRDIETGSRWRAFADASAYPALSAAGGEIVTEDWLSQNGADYSRPWLAGNDEEGDAEKGSARMHIFKAKRRAWYVRAQRRILRSPVVPMVIRMNVWFFSAIALGLAGSIHHITDSAPSSIRQTPSTYMAIIVDAVAMVYLLYITYDEYSGKPLGLRSARAKMRLIFLDLFFIVFDSANLSLAFETFRDPICTAPLSNQAGICARQKGLASVLLIALIAWLLTFSISVMRLIERVSGR